MIITIDENVMVENRFLNLMHDLNMTRCHTIGILVVLWSQSQISGKYRGARATLIKYLPFKGDEGDRVFDALVRNDYIKQLNGPDLFEIKGVRKRLNNHSAHQGDPRVPKRASRATMKSTDSPVDKGSSAGASPDGNVEPAAHEVKPLVEEKPKLQRVETGPTWQAYSRAFHERYRAAPVRNVTVNSQMANFVRRVGVHEAPDVAEFYVRHNEVHYVRSMHSVGAMLRDAEALRTQWVTGKVVSSRRPTTSEANMQAIGDLWEKNQKGEL